MKAIKDMTTVEMLAEYNKLLGKSTKRFASRAKGEVALLKAREEVQGTDAKATEVKDRSEAIRESWNDETVAAARSRRDGVKVAGHGEHRSVAAAFRAIGLPMLKHIPFRAKLKADGAATFKCEDSDGKTASYKFAIVQKETK